MPLYESTFIARQDISQADAAKLAENFSEVITENGGSIVKSEYWGLRSFAYRINKSRKGHYHMLGIDAAPSALQEMERLMRLNDDVVRVVTIRVDEISNEPSAVLQSGSNDSRGGSRPNSRTSGGNKRREG